MMQQTIGTDTEFFIILGEENKIIPPLALNTDFGLPIEEFRDKLLLYTHRENVSQPVSFSLDGGAVELYTNPYTNSTSLLKDVQVSLKGLSEYLVQNGFKLSKRIVGEFDVKKYWENRDERFLDTVRIGCNPDASIWEMLLEKPTSGERRIDGDPYRYSGGHLQISSPKGKDYFWADSYIEATFLIDHILGTRNVLLKRTQQELDDEKHRLNQYGHPGRIRLQNYPNGDTGLEYRPPSSRWIWDSTEVGNKLYATLKVVTKAVEMGVATKFLDENYNEGHFNKIYNGLVSFDPNFAKITLNNTLAFLVNNQVINEKQQIYFMEQ